MADLERGDNKGWADSPIFRKGFLIFLLTAALAASAAGFVPALQNHHPHFDGEGAAPPAASVWRALSPVFFAVYGFAAFSFIVLVGQHLRRLVGRKENYYDERE